jgi:repressor LexA
MASKAARQEPTLKGYHTGTRVEAEDTIPRRCVLLEKTQGLTGGFLRESMPGCRASQDDDPTRGARSRKKSGRRCCAEKPRAGKQPFFRNVTSCLSAPLEACGESNAKQKSSLTFAFFSPKVPVEIICEWRRRMALTKRQKEVLDYLVAFETKHGYAPSFEEIGKGLKLTSLATVHKHITTLEKKGFIRRGYNQSRSIEIIQLPKSVKDQISDRKLQELPLVGRIAAGRPLEAVEQRETISLGDFARDGNSFVLQVKGSSMIEDHIMDGDFVVCEQTQVANAGDIVVALIGGEEATLKRFYREGAGKIRLQPANSEMAPIMVAANDVKIQGRVIGVLRKY